jgi:hypothetical protein
MGLGLVSSGAASLNNGAGETTVVSDAHGGVFVAHVDAQNATSTKVLTARLVGKVRNNGQLIRLAVASATGVIADPTPAIVTCGPIITTEQLDLRLLSTDVASTSYPWRLDRIGQIAFSAENDQAATVGVEHILDTETVPGAYVLLVDLSNMQAADTVELRLKTRVRNTDTVRLVQYVTKTNAQTDPAAVLLTAEVVLDNLQATLKQTAGTGRTFPWKLLRL